jgi:hypothetical protein
VAREKQVAIVYQQGRIPEGDLPKVIRFEAERQMQAFRFVYTKGFAGKAEHRECQLHLLGALTRGRR